MARDRGPDNSYSARRPGSSGEESTAFRRLSQSTSERGPLEGSVVLLPAVQAMTWFIRVARELHQSVLKASSELASHQRYPGAGTSFRRKPYRRGWSVTAGPGRLHAAFTRSGRTGASCVEFCGPSWRAFGGPLRPLPPREVTACRACPQSPGSNPAFTSLHLSIEVAIRFLHIRDLAASSISRCITFPCPWSWTVCMNTCRSAVTRPYNLTSLPTPASSRKKIRSIPT
jgi:hypothetical protein